jgi:outer membrane protein OmpA-like peptidoglycan-associated protein
MQDNPTAKLLIKAYCDSRGSMTYNQTLSMSRAMAVKGYFLQKGIKRERIQAEWYGEERPLNNCVDDVPCTEDEYEVNRRAELKVVAGSVSDR